jgi:hypothetical protein
VTRCDWKACAHEYPGGSGESRSGRIKAPVVLGNGFGGTPDAMTFRREARNRVPALIDLTSRCNYSYYMASTELKVARIGNSRGIRIPAGTLEALPDRRHRRDGGTE